MKVTSRINAIAHVALDCMAADDGFGDPVDVDEILKPLRPHESAAIRRGLQRPKDLREWAKEVNRQWAGIVKRARES